MSDLDQADESGAISQPVLRAVRAEALFEVDTVEKLSARAVSWSILLAFAGVFLALGAAAVGFLYGQIGSVNDDITGVRKETEAIGRVAAGTQGEIVGFRRELDDLKKKFDAYDKFDERIDHLEQQRPPKKSHGR